MLNSIANHRFFTRLQGSTQPIAPMVVRFEVTAYSESTQGLVNGLTREFSSLEEAEKYQNTLKALATRYTSQINTKYY